MQVSAYAVALTVHYRPGVVETRPGLGEIPTDLPKRSFAASGNPLEQPQERLMIEQVRMAVPAPLIGDLDSLRSLRPKRQDRSGQARGVELLRQREAPQWRWEEQLVCHGAGSQAHEPADAVSAHDAPDLFSHCV